MVWSSLTKEHCQIHLRMDEKDEGREGQREVVMIE